MFKVDPCSPGVDADPFPCFKTLRDDHRCFWSPMALDPALTRSAIQSFMRQRASLITTSGPDTARAHAGLGAGTLFGGDKDGSPVEGAAGLDFGYRIACATDVGHVPRAPIFSASVASTASCWRPISIPGCRPGVHARCS